MADPSTDEMLATHETVLRETLHGLYNEYAEGSRAYYPESGERDENDHYASLALHAFKPLLDRLVELEAAQPSALEAANQAERLQRLSKLLGLLAPGGTAPRTALEQLYDQSDVSTDESPAVLELRRMLQPHWGEWPSSPKSSSSNLL